ncbi:cytoplasmic protein [Trabulsiella odontotermitis]|uniref:cytoplasmic protein n=1 Tax=Trabulsiella odontotermitis TaxID=379893 RepID=UPI0024B85C4C|nr:cytoplasmic protein [Trabulsiella odontotermitis]WHP31991.1 cytoplasmic protein [Trabulsiella odontotermitis]
MKDVEDNNVYLTLDDRNSDDIIRHQNLTVLINEKNAAIEHTAQAVMSIPAALVKMKWQNRRDIYAWQVKEEIYGAAIEEIIARKPELKEKLLARIEANYQHILAREAATLRLSRRLAEGKMRTANVNNVALDDTPKKKK